MEQEMPQTFNEKKFKELVLYLAETSKDDKFFGAVKLNKLLFFSDFLAFGYLGASITGARYIHLPKGPAPREMMRVRTEMEKAGVLLVEDRRAGVFTQHRPVAKSLPDMSVFSAPEREIIDSVIEMLGHQNAVQVSDQSHDWIGWLYTDDKEEIPYHTVFVRRREPVTRADFAWARGVVESAAAASN